MFVVSQVKLAAHFSLIFAKYRLPFTLKVSIKKSLESIKAVHGKESPKWLSMNCLILLNCIVIAWEKNEELTWRQQLVRALFYFYASLVTVGFEVISKKVYTYWQFGITQTNKVVFYWDQLFPPKSVAKCLQINPNRCFWLKKLVPKEHGLRHWQ